MEKLKCFKIVMVRRLKKMISMEYVSVAFSSDDDDDDDERPLE